MAHTPGPWTLETVETQIGTCHKIGPFPCNSGTRSETHACVYADNIRLSDYGHSKVGDELLANARLIAAAPQMLEALRELMGLAQREGWDHVAVNMARAALAKAQGKEG